ncbi:MAG: glutamate--cysteine ligase [gamma proteobacterium symbiont of Bathyaustriella thionipta]|nr:glutamate--cysteine ligase [gamma proteobacterium symbiont of Bathyaustriella thionipta]
MNDKLKSALKLIVDNHLSDHLAAGVIGLEKEGVRTEADGGFALSAHPLALGSALTHPWITTDYSEAMLEFVTPATVGPEAALEFLDRTHRFVYSHLQDEFIWTASMPCILHCGEQIPLARYGESNQGEMKTVYRRGLGHRYGRVMQVISGVHFNYSLEQPFWPAYQQLLGDNQSAQDFINQQYFGMIRNLQRAGWLVPYLFGASPAVCKSFLCGKPTRLQSFNDTTYFEPYATSLRMGDIGYQNEKEFETGLNICYDNVQSYVDSLRCAIQTPCADYAKIGIKVNGQYQQLNANILQIENEYYSTVRPKQIPLGNEMPVHALLERGVRYVELRSIDINPYEPNGVGLHQLRILELLMLSCLLRTDSTINLQERQMIDANLRNVAHRGRQPGLMLQRPAGEVRLQAWAEELLDAMDSIAIVLDGAKGGHDYQSAVARQRIKVDDPACTPSAIILQEMQEQGEGFHAIGRRLSEQHQQYFCKRPLSAAQQKEFERAGQISLEQQLDIEAADTQSFDEYLAAYFNRKRQRISPLNPISE